MKPTALEQVKEQLRAFTPPERAEIADYLLTSLEPESTQEEEDFDATLLRRLDEIRSGEVEGIPWEVALAELEALDEE